MQLKAPGTLYLGLRLHKNLRQATKFLVSYRLVKTNKEVGWFYLLILHFSWILVTVSNIYL